ncbi:hypothetical protein [Enterobacter hormaechei]|uniref:Uncharacterized protein n=1 Tax=Enterobacter hormaechei TaxID=158836 RepID=A0A6L3Y0S6_9ENTR|nr:hypothetical protein [Enterobacter hormaechei]KAB2528464.1 hypothetical protein F9C29_05785 [Enterobacter hormaechei]
MTIDRILSIIAILVSLIGVPASGYLSYRYATKGEKRKEFNLVADVLRYKFREQLRLLEQNVYPVTGKLEVTESEIDVFLDVSRKRHSGEIKKAWVAYQNSLKNSGSFTEYNDYKMHDSESVKKTIYRLMYFMNRR